MTLQFREKAYIASVAILVMGVLFFALELARPACGRFFSIAHGATCPAGDNITIGGSLITDQGATINEDGNDADTRIEGDTETDLLYVDAGNERVGIGDSAPSTKLDIESGSVNIDTNQFFQWGGSSANALLYDGAVLSSSVGGASRLRVQSRGAVIGAASNLSSGTNLLIFEDGASPGSVPTNTAGIFADDNGGTVHMYTVDETGTLQQFSPHPSSVSTQAPGTCKTPFFHFSENVYTGVRTVVDWCLIMADLANVTGNTYITESQIPANEVRDWWADQAAKRAECIGQGRSIGPNACQEKAPPQWMIDAGVSPSRP